jgi:hypothetical protein
MSYGITVVSGTVPATSETFPDFLQFQANGDNLGAADADTVNFVGGDVTRGTGESSNVVTVNLDGFSWNDEAGDYTLALTDAMKGVSTSGTTGAQTILVPGDTGDATLDFTNGASIVIYQEGAAAVYITPVSGVTVRVRSGLTLTLAGQYATVTLIKRRANEWVACGDLTAV